MIPSYMGINTPIHQTLSSYRNKSIRILELTIYISTNALNGLRDIQNWKLNKQDLEYGTLFSNLETKGWTVSYNTIEIGSL